ncbi:hypothetical protein GWN26_01610 [Candidatus Saccharibacteria bacterium]|nr:hypothetical protein [Candidatus Saccharibacteria bacterium]NIW80974.1 hypothetical protein [Calditrichia bacterium]
MSLEKKCEALLDATTNLIKSVNDMIGSGKTDADPVTGEPKADKIIKKELAALKKSAKEKAGDVLKKLGKEKLEELLSRFGAKSFGKLLNEIDVFEDFIKKADEMIEKEDDDLLGGDDEEKEYTLEDVKALLLKVNNAAELGKDVTRQILGELGVARLPELKKEKFAEAVKTVKATLDKAGVKYE